MAEWKSRKYVQAHRFCQCVWSRGSSWLQIPVLRESSIPQHLTQGVKLFSNLGVSRLALQPCLMVPCLFLSVCLTTMSRTATTNIFWTRRAQGSTQQPSTPLSGDTTQQSWWRESVCHLHVHLPISIQLQAILQPPSSLIPSWPPVSSQTLPSISEKYPFKFI